MYRFAGWMGSRAARHFHKRVTSCVQRLPQRIRSFHAPVRRARKPVLSSPRPGSRRWSTGGARASSVGSQPTVPKGLWGGFAVVGVGAGVAACLAYLKQQELKSGSEVEIYENLDGAMDSDKATPLVTIGGIISKELDQPVDYVHPYSKTPWFYQAFVRMKRTVFLALIFSPCALCYGLSELTQTAYFREVFLNVLITTVEWSGCSIQKFAQWCSMRPDMFPADMIKALSRLRCEAPRHSFSHTRRIIRASLGRDIEEIFESFDEEPIASGTVAQVHRARLRPEHAIGGSIRDVAVKIQHPNVLEETFCDVDLLWKFVKSVPTLAMPMAKEDFALVLQRQTNFEWEAYNLQRLAINFKKEVGEGIVRFPDVATDLLSPAVLVESWADGATVGRFFSEIKHGVRKIKETTRRIGEEIENAWDKQKRELAEKLFELNMKMFLRDNLVHSDMHAGNILFSEENGEITVLDAGQTATLHSDIAPRFGQFLHSICTRNKQGVHENLIAFDTDRGEKLDDPDAFKARVFEAMDEHCAPGQKIIVGDIMGELLRIMSTEKVCLRSDVSVSLMAMAVSEGLIRSLDPEFHFTRSAMPFIARYGLFNTDAHTSVAVSD